MPMCCLQAFGSAQRPGQGVGAADAAPSIGAALLDAVTAFPGLADEDDKYQVPASYPEPPALAKQH